MATTYNITTISGDTYNGAIFTITVNGIALDMTNYTAKMQIRTNRDSVAKAELTNGDGLTFTDAANGKIAIDAQIFTIVPGSYKYDIELTSPGGVVKTYIKGNFIVTEDITHG